MDKNIIDKYEIWKSSIENGEFYFISDEEYDEFTKIYENEVKIQEILTIQQEDVVENELHITEFIEENDFLEDTQFEYIENVIYLLWFIIFSALFSINMNTNIYEETNIYEDLSFLFF